jgi:fructose-bisphosphate aldolase, class II
MLVTTQEIFQDAYQKKYAVGAFNINNMEIIQAIVETADEEKSPVILGVSEGAIKYAGLEYLAAMVKVAASETRVPIAFHLDHGTTYEVIIRCIAGGMTSVMIDGSKFGLEENIVVTREIVKVAHACGISVEAELGRLGGIEDNINVDERDARFTKPEEANIFVAETRVDSLAIAIGTAHGLYKGVPNLDLPRLEEIAKLINMPIVLHGASGVPDDQITEAVKRGVNKINIDTDVRLAFTAGLKEVILNQPEVFDPRKICAPSKTKMKEVVRNKIRLFGSSNRV